MVSLRRDNGAQLGVGGPTNFVDLTCEVRLPKCKNTFTSAAMNSTTHDTLLRDLFTQLCSPTSGYSDAYYTAVCVRADNKNFHLYPEHPSEVTFRSAVAAIKCRIAIKTRTFAIQAVLSN